MVHNCHCGKCALYNVAGGKPLYCRVHKEPAMINVSTKKCDYKGGCLTRPSFGIVGQKEKYCSVHKEPGMGDACHEK